MFYVFLYKRVQWIVVFCLLFYYSASFPTVLCVFSTGLRVILQVCVFFTLQRVMILCRGFFYCSACFSTVQRVILLFCVLFYCSACFFYCSACYSTVLLVIVLFCVFFICSACFSTFFLLFCLFFYCFSTVLRVILLFCVFFFCSACFSTVLRVILLFCLLFYCSAFYSTVLRVFLLFCVLLVIVLFCVFFLCSACFSTVLCVLCLYGPFHGAFKLDMPTLFIQSLLLILLLYRSYILYPITFKEVIPVSFDKNWWHLTCKFGFTLKQLNSLTLIDLINLLDRPEVTHSTWCERSRIRFPALARVFMLFFFLVLFLCFPFVQKTTTLFVMAVFNFFCNANS